MKSDYYCRIKKNADQPRIECKIKKIEETTGKERAEEFTERARVMIIMIITRQVLLKNIGLESTILCLRNFKIYSFINECQIFSFKEKQNGQLM
jgi:hypothetical protein